jgi:hypothetical protein
MEAVKDGAILKKTKLRSLPLEMAPPLLRLLANTGIVSTCHPQRRKNKGEEREVAPTKQREERLQEREKE